MTTPTASAVSPFAEKPVLTGTRVVLRPVTEADAPAMAEVVADPEVLRLTGAAHLGYSLDRLRAVYRSREEAADRLDLAVTDRETGAFVGESVLFDWDPHNRSCAFRIALGPAGQDRGFGTETVELTLRHGFEAIGLHRIWLWVYTFNPRARRVYEKAGFTVEGVEREALMYDGAWYDAVRMSLLDRDWAARAARA